MVYQTPHPAKMGPIVIEPAACLAVQRTRFRGQPDIASGATAQGLDQPMEVETLEHLLRLMARSDASHLQSVLGFARRTLASEKNAPLGFRHGNNFRGATSLALARVETEHAQIGRQPLQAWADRKAGMPQGLRPHLGYALDIKGFENRIYADSITITYQVRQAHRFAVAHDEINLVTRDTQRTKQPLDRY
jgi:hypothetical protein